MGKFIELKNAIEFAASRINKPIIAAEIGVRAGEHALVMLKGLPIDNLYLIDNYLPYQDGPIFRSQAEQDGYYISMFKLFNNSKDLLDKVVFITRSSEFAANNLFPDNFFDLVYIDANHDYQEVKKDLKLWFSKIKPGGYFCGHDYQNGWPGVPKAVDEFIEEKKLQLFKLNSSDWLVINNSI